MEGVIHGRPVLRHDHSHFLPKPIGFERDFLWWLDTIRIFSTFLVLAFCASGSIYLFDPAPTFRTIFSAKHFFRKSVVAWDLCHTPFWHP